MNIEKNYKLDSYERADFKRYFHGLCLDYANQYDFSPEGLALLATIVRNILTHPDEEKYRYLNKGSTVKDGKVSKLYRCVTSTEKGRLLFLMLGFREKVWQFEMKWFLAFEDRIAFYPEVLQDLEKRRQYALDIKITPLLEAKKKSEEQDKRVAALKEKLKGDRVSRTEIDWVRRGQSNRPLYGQRGSNDRSAPQAPGAHEYATEGYTLGGSENGSESRYREN